MYLNLSANLDIRLDNPSFYVPLHVPELGDMRNTLQIEIQAPFNELQVDIVNCPCLSRPPFNLAGIRVCGNPYVIEFGEYETFYAPDKFTETPFDVAFRTASVFAIGSEYAKDYMQSTINNASRIVFADTSNGQRKIETITSNHQLFCACLGNIFSIDGVLIVRKGRVACNVTPEDFFPTRVSSFEEFSRLLQCHEIELESDLVAVGVIYSRTEIQASTEERYGIRLYKENKYRFNSFSDYGAGGEFLSDTTSDETEYEAYFHIAYFNIKKIFTVGHEPDV
ncbi:hypothetical protein P5V15_001010 [Pogonomyrmex californicus]